jgi:hypothetical protein
MELARAVPWVRDALDETEHLVRAAELSGHAALGTLDVAANALRGPDAIIARDPDDPKGGSRIRLERIEAIARTIDRVRADIAGVKRELNAVDASKLPHRVRPSIQDGLEKANDTDALLADAAAGFDLLPRFLGRDGPRVYLVAMQNPAELRGTGGSILQFAVLRFDSGKPSLDNEASTVYDVDKNRVPIDIPLPDDAWYVANITDAQRFGNANWSPDWPLSARLTMEYALASAPRFDHFDGVILVDPLTVQKLIPGTGTYNLGRNGQGIPITANRVVNFVLYKAYGAYPIKSYRRAVLRQVVNGFFERLLDPAHPTELVEGMGDSLSEKHMQIWFADPAEQAFIDHMDWDGGLRPATDADYLNVVQQNVGGNKLDYHATMNTRVGITITDADAVTSTDVTIENNVFLPQPRWAMGDSGPNHRPMVNVYVRPEAQLVSAAVFPKRYRIDTPAPAAVWTGGRPAEHRELTKKVWSATLGDPGILPPGIPPQKKATFRVVYRVPDIVRTVNGRKIYRLVVQHQPKVRPELLAIDLALPPDARDVVAKGWKRDGDLLLWERLLKKDVVLEVSWR